MVLGLSIFLNPIGHFEGFILIQFPVLLTNQEVTAVRFEEGESMQMAVGTSGGQVGTHFYRYRTFWSTIIPPWSTVISGPPF